MGRILNLTFTDRVEAYGFTLKINILVVFLFTGRSTNLKLKEDWVIGMELYEKEGVLDLWKSEKLLSKSC